MTVRVLAAALALFLMGPGTLGAMPHQCKMRRALENHMSCCHEGAGEHGHEATGRPTLERDHMRCCCSLDGSEQPALVGEGEPPRPDLSLVAVFAPTRAAAPNPRAVVRANHRSRAPPGALGPSIFLRNCSYLI